MISILFAHHLLRKCCMKLLVYVYDTSANEVNLGDVPMVQDFPDVVLDKLPRLPWERELEFAINLVLRTHPISLPPYKMTLAELKELKVQF